MVECLSSTKRLWVLSTISTVGKENVEISHSMNSTDVYFGFVEYISAQTLNTKYRQLFMGLSV